jgi:tRNA pseudouridine55 synthase
VIRDTRSGILPVDKGPDVTSFQVVAQLRRVLGAPKIGHGGTLDPAATGLLPILIGEATKLTPYLVELDKEYLATVRLGVSTDTQDLAGAVLESRPVPELDEASIGKALAPFVGLIRQVPPMYSALHHEGRRLYELAREGVEVERQAREVTVHAIHLEALTLPDLVLRVTCGKGFYVRALAADLGAAIGTGGALARLVRTRVGPYRLEEAAPWSLVLSARDGESLWVRALSPDSALQAMPAARLSEPATRAFANGQSVTEPGAPGLVRVYGADGALLGIGVRRGALLKPERLLHADTPRSRVLPA